MASRGKNWYSLKQAMTLPKMEMERNLMLIGLQQARENLKRRLEEADIWDKLYENEKMLQTSISNRFTWGDVLDGMVDILPPREVDPITQTHAEVNRKFMTFKAKKMKELFGTQKSQKPSYRSLYMGGRNPKEINDRNYKSLIERHQSERDRLFRNQNIHTANLPKITEEDWSGGDVRSPNDTTTTTDTTTSGKSLGRIPKEEDTVAHITTAGSDSVGENANASTSSNKLRRRKLSNVPLTKGTLTLAKSNIVLEGVPGQLKLPEQLPKNQQQGNSNKRKDSADSFSGYSKLPPISNSEEY